HCCSVASSRHVLFSPFSSRTIHWRSLVGPLGGSLTSTGASLGGRARVSGGRLGAFVAARGPGGAASLTVGKPTFVGVRFRILNMCPQLVHLTVTPPGLSRLSSSSYSVWHFSQRTSMFSAGCPVRYHVACLQATNAAPSACVSMRSSRCTVPTDR